MDEDLNKHKKKLKKYEPKVIKVRISKCLEYYETNSFRIELYAFT